MKYVKMLGLAAVAAAALMAFVGAGTASATQLTSPAGTVLKTGSTIHAVNSGTVTLTTSFKNIECEESTVQGTTSNESGASINGTVNTLTFGKCNCEVKVISGGTLAITASGSPNGSLASSGAEVTSSCSTIFGNVHCIYVTNGTTLGTLTGGTPAVMDISSANIPRLSTSGLCAEKANWDATYKVDSPGTLLVD